ncbi:signal peptidase I [Candidatus Peregrinibacteria bacterium]|nr:signal peptidase I [Candidatus Peregrinibacteria bacterium]
MSLFNIIVSVLTLQFLSLSVFAVSGDSMVPTLHDGDIFVIETDLENAELNRDSIVVFSLEDQEDFFYVKRIIGLPGEKIILRNGEIFIDVKGNELKLEEDFLEENVRTFLKSSSYKDDYEQAFSVPEESYFVLGDNRVDSEDSRYFSDPFVRKEQIKGIYLNKLL